VSEGNGQCKEEKGEKGKGGPGSALADRAFCCSFPFPFFPFLVPFTLTVRQLQSFSLFSFCFGTPFAIIFFPLTGLPRRNGTKGRNKRWWGWQEKRPSRHPADEIIRID
jgi:hypothetical protein